jgi:3-phenylpropionate/cinnamic acid dioxygenase small subunit
MVDQQVLGQIEALQLDYIRALNGANMQGWADCFDDTASYSCFTRESEDQHLPIALMLDDTRDRIADRVTYVNRVWAGTVEEYNTRHFLQRLSCVVKTPSLYALETQFLVAYTTTKGLSALLVVGVYFDEIVVGGERAKFRSRKAVLDTVVSPRYLVYPV